MPVRLTAEPLDRRDTPATVGAADPAFASFAASLAPGTNQLNAGLVQPDGRLVFAGATDATNGDFVAVRLNADGSPDTTFAGTGKLVIPSFAAGSDDQAVALARQSNGSLILAGWTNKGGTYDLAAVRLTAAGVLDTTFGTAGYAILNPGGADKAYAVAVGADDRIVLAGSADGTDSVAVARLTPDGQPDPTFRSGTVRKVQLGGTEEARGVAVYTDNTILVAGWRTIATGTDTVAFRLAGDGSFTDASIGTDTFTAPGENVAFARLDAGGEDKALAVTLLADNRFVTAGYATVGGAKQVAVARFTSAGRPDTSFNSTGLTRLSLGGSDDQATALVVDTAGRPTVAATSVTGSTSKAAAVRFTAAGASDVGFGSTGVATVTYGAGASGSDRAQAVAIDAAGRVVVAGRAAASAAAARLVGNIGLPSTAVVSGPGTGGGVRLTVPAGGTAFDPAAIKTVTFFSSFTGGVRTTAADLNGDGVPELIAAAGPGSAPVLTVRDGATDRVLVQPLAVFELTFTGGLFVTAADLTGDGRADVIVSPDQGGGPVIAVYDGARLAAGDGANAAAGRFYGIEDVNFRGGARTAAGDLNGDGRADLIVAAGFGGGPRIAVYTGTSVLTPLPAATATSVSVPPRLLAQDFFAFEDTLRNGAYVTAGDLDGDGVADLWFGGGPGGGPRVRVVSGRQLVTLNNVSRLDDAPATGLQLANFFAGDASGRGGVPLAAKDVDGDQIADLVTASGQGQAARVLVYRGVSVRATAAPAADQTLDLFSGNVVPGGVYVG